MCLRLYVLHPKQLELRIFMRFGNGKSIPKVSERFGLVSVVRELEYLSDCSN